MTVANKFSPYYNFNQGVRFCRFSQFIFHAEPSCIALHFNLVYFVLVLSFPKIVSLNTALNLSVFMWLNSINTNEQVLNRTTFYNTRYFNVF